VIHLADERNRSTEHDGAHGNRRVGKIRLVASREPRSDPMGAGDAGEEHAKAGGARDRRPIGSNKREERGRDQ
jgi:hypothetical protein